MNGHKFGHKFMSVSMYEADSDMRFFGSSDTDSDKVMTSDTDTRSDTVLSDNLGRGHGQTTDTRCSVITHYSYGSGESLKLNKLKGT